MSDRYARQRLLASVGDVGQERIAAWNYVVTSDSESSATVERQYLARAGARHFTAAGGTAVAFVHAAEFRHPAAREFAAGAWRALSQLRNALDRD